MLLLMVQAETEFLNATHPKYDPAMEVLCRIRQEPHYTYLKVLATRFGQVDQWLVQRWIRMLQVRFAGIRTGNKCGRAVWVTRDAWPTIEQAAGKYYEEVYPMERRNDPASTSEDA